MTDSGTVTPDARATLTITVALVNETDTLKDITSIPPINFRGDPRHEKPLEVIKN